MKAKRIAIIGGGNLGSALAQGWKDAGTFKARNIMVTRRHADKLETLAKQGIRTGSDNQKAVIDADIIVLAIQPGQMEDVLAGISPVVDAERHLVISTLTGVTIERIANLLPPETIVVRAMPNTAVETRTSMTCLSVDEQGRGRDETQKIFEDVGATLFIDEEMMIPATALCACGIAFFLRTIRAAAQGGTEIGFHADEALLLAAQTARGAADLILQGGAHPEQEIDRVTTPKGCTIAGLNELEHRGFSSAMIRGILTSAERAAGLG
jgi:pyrroline-5-carboxylate reductase